MTITPTLLLHIAGGIAGLLSGWMALFARKGGRLHRKAGVVFGISMLIMAASGGYISILHAQWLNVLAGTFTFYLVITAWLTVKRKPQELGRAEYVLLALGLSVGIGGWLLAARVSNAGEAIALRVFGTVAIIASAGDIRMLIRGGIAGAPRLARHLWRMCIALFIATASFLVGRAGDPVLRKTGLRARLFDSIRDTHVLEIPIFLLLLLTVFWLVRVRVREGIPKGAGRGLTPRRGDATMRRGGTSDVRGWACDGQGLSTQCAGWPSLGQELSKRYTGVGQALDKGGPSDAQGWPGLGQGWSRRCAGLAKPGTRVVQAIAQAWPGDV